MKFPSVHVGKKKGSEFAPSMPEGGNIPIDRVATLSSQGMSEPEIIRTLRSEGYSPMEVDAAMKDALRSAVRPSQPRFAPSGPPRAIGQQEGGGRRFIFGDEENLTRTSSRSDSPFPEEESPNELELPRFSSRSTQPRRPGLPLPMENEDIDELEPIMTARTSPKQERMQSRREFEEIAEGVVEEKLANMEKRVDDMGERLKELSLRINNVQQAFDRLQGERRGDIAEITDRIESYRQGIAEMSSRMESVERTMKDSMTPMMQSLRSLSDAVKSFKDNRR